jgi:hypothetical protein
VRDLSFKLNIGMRAGAALGALGTVALLLAILSPGGARGYNFLQPKSTWKGSPAKIRYYNAARPQDAAVRDAVDRWNHSGIDVKFQRVSSAKRAEVIIKGDKQAPCGNGLAVPQYVSNDGKHFHTVSGKVYLGTGGQNKATDTPEECRYIDVITAAHELGHILGLDHEDRRCAVMNSSNTTYPDFKGKGPVGVAPSSCKGGGSDRWYCRVLTGDDLKGARKLYGGHPQVRKKAFCPIGSAKAGRASPAVTVTDDARMAP